MNKFIMSETYEWKSKCLHDWGYVLSTFIILRSHWEDVFSNLTPFWEFRTSFGFRQQGKARIRR